MQLDATAEDVREMLGGQLAQARGIVAGVPLVDEVLQLSRAPRALGPAVHRQPIPCGRNRGVVRGVAAPRMYCPRFRLLFGPKGEINSPLL